ncbi:MAG TPA: hypothetical protein VKE51_35890 [Vicinamibacterales bacterium]|nr:hypothetical protein [Vicinamibacterales bacterium]
MIHSNNPLVHFRRRRPRNETELVIGRSAVRVILAVITLALAAALALTGSEHARDALDAIRRLPF